MARSWLDEETPSHLPSLTGILEPVSRALVFGVIITVITVNPDPYGRREMEVTHWLTNFPTDSRQCNI